MNEGVFSLWKGQRPLKVRPAFLRATRGYTMSTMLSRSLISSIGLPMGISTTSLSEEPALRANSLARHSWPAGQARVSEGRRAMVRPHYLHLRLW